MGYDQEGVVTGRSPAEDEMSEAEIDENIKETFPASDPPSWTLGTDHRSESSEEDSPEETAPDRPPKG